ncbi:hypothetical protein [Alkaliphilus serpentinus]|nr:hypothetical protein [Alkaliphilus serpentinus]
MDNQLLIKRGKKGDKEEYQLIIERITYKQDFNRVIDIISD